jgi:four helix bundle protein
MVNSDLKVRTKEYALSVIRLFAELPKRTEAQVMGRQALRSGTSVGAQYREASRAKSNADFISEIEGSLQGFGGNRILVGIARRIWIDPGTESGRAQAGNR